MNEDPDDDQASSMKEVVDSVGDAAIGDETVRVGDVLDELGHASVATVLMAPALAVVSPLSGVPIFSSICGILIAVLSAQLLVGRRSLWVPEWIAHQQISSRRVRRSMASLRKPAAWLDRRVRRRMTFLVEPPLDRVAYLVCLICGLAMPLLELLPFTSSMLGATVALMALTLLVRDGLFSAIAYGVAAAAFATAGFLVF